MAGHGSWSLRPSSGLLSLGLGPSPDPAWDRAQGSPGLEPSHQGPCPAHVSTMLAVRKFTLFYFMLPYLMLWFGYLTMFM
jgi:hypothetical protein